MKNLILVCLLSVYFGFAQNEQDLWWFQTSDNKIYEKSYRNFFSEFSDGLLKEQVKEFIKTHISKTIRDKEEIAIKITHLLTSSDDEKTYNITGYYNELSFKPDIQQIAEIEGKIILINEKCSGDFKIKKEVLFGMLRSKFKDEANYLRNEYENLKQEGGGVPILFASNHHVPNWNIKIRNGKVIDKMISYH
jgi:hypothetical protein